MVTVNNRVKVRATGGLISEDFTLNTPVESFVAFPTGETNYTVVASTGEWQVGKGTVSGNSLTRGVVETNHLGTVDQIDFTGLVIQIAQVNPASVINAEASKLEGIEDNATADLDGAEIKALYEAESDTNAFTNAEKTKLAGMQDGATGDLTDVEVKTAYENNLNTNEFNDAEKAKLNLIEDNATQDMTSPEIKIAYELNTDTNVFTDNERDKLALIDAGAKDDLTGPEIKALYEANSDTNAFTNDAQTKLSNIEDNATADLTGPEIKSSYENEADTNAFTDAEKLQLATIETGAKDDQVASEVPFTPTAEVPQVDVQLAIEQVASNVLSHTQSATTITYDSSSDLLIDSTEVQDALSKHSLHIEQREASKTGIISGGLLTAVLDTTVFSIQPGVGEIYNSYDDPNNTQVTSVIWNEFIDISIGAELGTLSVANLRVFIGSNTGTPFVLKVPGKVPLDTYREHIFLGSVTVVNGTISSIEAAPSVVRQTSTDAYDLMQENVSISGGELISIPSGLTMWQKQGSVFFPGINWHGTDHKNPNTFIFVASSPDNTPNPQNPMFFSGLVQSGVLSSIDALTDVPINYDLNGVLTPLPIGTATIHRMYAIGLTTVTRKYVLLYGQNLYATAFEAKNAILTDNIVSPEEVDSMYFIGYIGIAEDALTFDDGTKAWIVSGEGGNTTSAALLTGDHTTLTNRDSANQHPIESIGDGTPETQLTAHLENKPEYAGTYITAGSYNYNELVLDGGVFAIVTNPAGTTDGPAPTLIGNPYDFYDNVDAGVTPPPPFSILDGGAVIVRTGMRYIFPNAGYVQSVKVKVPEITSNTNYKVVVIIDPDGLPISTIANDPVVSTTEFLEVALLNTFIKTGTVVLIYLEAQTLAGSSTTATSYVHLPPNNNNDPGIGEAIYRADGNTTKIHITDDNAGDQSLVLAAATSGDTVTFTQTNDNSKIITLTFTGPGTLTGGTHYEYPSYISSTNNGGPDNDATVDADITLFTAGATKYLEEVDYLIGTDMEIWADGFKTVNGIVQAVANNAYSVEVTFQEAAVSEDWQILASSDIGATGGAGGVTPVSWGNLTGTLSNQADLQVALDLKVDDTQVLTDVPAGAQFTDTTYTHPSDGADPGPPKTGAAVFNDISVNASGHVTGTTTRDLTPADISAEATANKGVANGYASLDSGGLVPTGQLPVDADEVIEYADVAAFPPVGVADTIYIAADENSSYRWDGGGYQILSGLQTAGEVILTPIGNIAATDVQAGIAELDAEKQPLSTILTNTTASFTSANESKLDAIAPNANLYVLPSSVVHDTEAMALHATDALKLVGDQLSLHKGDGSSEAVTLLDTTANELITLSGDVSGSGTNSISVTITNDSHSHTTGTISDLSGINTGDEPDATTSVKGVVELATQVEVDAGTDTQKAVTPSTLAGMPVVVVSAGDVVFTPTGAVGASDVQAAITELDNEKQPLSAALTGTTAPFTIAYETILNNLTDKVVAIESAMPGSPAEGDEWFNEDNGYDYTWLASGNGQWVRSA